MEKQPEHEEAIALLKQGAGELGINLSDKQLAQYYEYTKLLQKWNKQINLTSITATNDIIIRHVFDSLAALPYNKGINVACIGSGGGTPGLIWAIADDNIEVTMIEPRTKRAQFLTYATANLNVKNAITVNERSERFNPSLKFDTLTCRALARLDEFINLSAHLSKDSTQWVALKGKLDQQEVIDAQKHISTVEAHTINVPMLDAERHVVVMHN